MQLLDLDLFIEKRLFKRRQQLVRMKFTTTKTLFRLAETEKSSDKEELKVNYSRSKMEQLTEVSPALLPSDFNYTMACSPNVFIKEV